MTKVTKANAAYRRMNSDLDLELGGGSMSHRGGSQSGMRTTAAGELNADERRKIKDQLREWKEKKHEIDNKERIDRITEEQKRKAQMQRKVQQERQAKRELVEDYKFRKEMEN